MWVVTLTRFAPQEGDSFILVMHSPAQALSYACKVQGELQDAAWPAALLEHPEAAAVWAAPADSAEALPCWPASSGGGGRLLSSWAARYYDLLTAMAAATVTVGVRSVAVGAGRRCKLLGLRGGRV
jgi:hypothetical protein